MRRTFKKLPSLAGLVILLWLLVMQGSAFTPFENLKQIPASAYSYDNVSKQITFSIIGDAWFNQPMPDDDPYNEFWRKNYNAVINYTAINGNDLEQKLLARFAAGGGEAPDLIKCWDRNILVKLWEQKLTVEDHAQLMKNMPNVSQFYTAQEYNLTKIDGKQYSIMAQPYADTWNWYVRKDWLAKLKIKMPTTESSLLAFCKAVKEKDPDGNGKADTYAFTSAGGNQNLGPLETIGSYIANPYIAIKNGKVVHPMQNGNRKKAINFIATLNKRGYLDPNWFSQDWGGQGNMWIGGRCAFIYYPGFSLLTDGMGGGKIDFSAWWQPLPPLKGTKRGGWSDPSPCAFWAISKKAAADPVKLNRILHWLDTITPPNEMYYSLRMGLNISAKPTKMEGVGWYFSSTGDYRFTDQHFSPTQDWGAIADDGGWSGWLSGPALKPDTGIEYVLKYNNEIAKMPLWENPAIWVTVDPVLVANMNDFAVKNEVKFILGQRPMSEWNNYVKEWLKAGGQKLIDEYTAALKKAGSM